MIICAVKDCRGPGNCESCGFEAGEAKRRAKLMKEKGLTRDNETGRWYLSIGRAEEQ